MPTLIKENYKTIAKYIAYFFLIVIGLYIFTIVLQFIFNLGTYLGTFMRCLYTFVCK